MGWFSKKKKIYVSSVVYNLAGGPENRVKYLPSVIATKIISNNNFSVSETLQSALIGGPGMRMRRYGQWARRTEYDKTVGMSTGKLTVGNSVDINTLTAYLQAGVDETIYIQTVDIGVADYVYWADYWLAENHPGELNDDYVVDFDELANIIYIRFGDPVTHTYQFSPVGFDSAGTYLYVSYQRVGKDVAEPIMHGDVVIVGSSSELPSVDGWVDEGNVSTPSTIELTTTTKVTSSFSDGRPDESEESSNVRTQDYTQTDDLFSSIEYVGQNPTGTEINSLRRYTHLMRVGAASPSSEEETTTETLPDGTIKTTITEVITENLVMAYAYQLDTQILIDRRWSIIQGLIYKYGSGNAELDAMFTPQVSSGTFFPFIPMRVDNRMVGPGYYTDIYNKNQKALEKATGAKYPELQASLEVNPSLRDIDYAYVVFGVPINTKEDVSKKYIYKFFQAMRSETGSGEGELNAWKAKWAVSDNSQRTWLSWKEAQSDPTNPLFGNPEPARIPYPPTPNNGIGIASPAVNYNITLYWSALAESTGTGQAWPGAKMGQLRMTNSPLTDYEELIVSGGLSSWRPNPQYVNYITWQDGVDTWRTMAIWNLVHINMIYKGKGVYTNGWEALGDPEESGLMIPLHEGIFKSMSLVDATQMSMASGYMVLNCYKVVKQKWYQTSWFKIILVIIVIVITVLSSGTGAGSAGLLGTAASVGAALGFVGAVAIIVGTIANAVAAMLLAQLLTAGAKALFGDEVGAVVGAIASVVAISVGTSMMSGQGMAAGFSNMANAENILKLTVAAGNGLAEYVGAKTTSIMQQTQELIDQYGQDSQAIMETWERNLGLGQVLIDPTVLTDSAQQYNYVPERSGVFLSRTLLTGSDIADMTNDLLTNFTKMTLSTELD